MSCNSWFALECQSSRSSLILESNAYFFQTHFTVHSLRFTNCTTKQAQSDMGSTMTSCQTGIIHMITVTQRAPLVLIRTKASGCFTMYLSFQILSKTVTVIRIQGQFMGRACFVSHYHWNSLTHLVNISNTRTHSITMSPFRKIFETKFQI